MLSVQTLVRVAEALKADPGSFLDGLTSEMFGGVAQPKRRAS
jgi:hypothetical protein